ncbi:guanylate kinase [Candidatus Peregrinibacteria bacterium]|jgi:guanylate kinase|nr:guanylate kinase [Candidatus Peregrinibacteria bacterium]
MENSGKLVLILGPSGSGKGTVLEFLKQEHPEFIFPLSCTTRPSRPTEKDGEVYRFISLEEFKEKIENDEFLEYAFIHDMHYYGTLKKPIMDALQEGRIVVREVDVQGVRSIRELLPPEQLVTIFLRADWDSLEHRIRNRAPISDEELAERHESFLKEMAWQDECDYKVDSIEGQIPEVCSDVDKLIMEVA